MLLDAAGRVLLLRHVDCDGRSFWATPGGGLEPGEAPEQAARREAREELGVEAGELNYLWTGRAEFALGARLIAQREVFFRLEPHAPLSAERALHRRAAEGIRELRWWSLAELGGAAAEPIFPGDLAARLREPGPAIREARPSERDRLRAFYAAQGYARELGAADRIFVAGRADELVAAVGLVVEHGAWVLRGMRVAPPEQRRGLGTRLLEALDAALGPRLCYCIPYAHLLGFYGQIGFRAIEPAQAPAFLAERLREYLRRRPDFALMRRPGARGAAPA